MSDDLFPSLFVPERLRQEVSGRAWVQAMLDVERALATVQARTGLIPATAAESIAAVCDATRFDIAALGKAGRAIGNPAEPLARALALEAGEEAGRYVHLGATSQDVLDTAAMLVIRTSLTLVLDDLTAVTRSCADLAATHRDTVMSGRTLLQQAVPITFGLKVAAWLVPLARGTSHLTSLRDTRLAVQLGGAAGTLASLGDQGLELRRLLAEELGLAEPPMTWHTDRAVLIELAAALAMTSAAIEKVALDVILLAQTEVAEVSEAGGAERGGSSTMPQKRNPVGSILARSCAIQARSAAAELGSNAPLEHERGAGGWQTEWLPLGAALSFTGGAAAALRDTLTRLEVYPERMRTNLDASGGLALAEQVASTLAPTIGRPEAKRLVREAVERSASNGTSLRDELGRPDGAGAHLDSAAIDSALDPERYLGASGAQVDHVLAWFDRELQ